MDVSPAVDVQTYTGPERRKPGRPARAPYERLLERLRHGIGPAWRVGDLAEVIGRSRYKIHADFDLGRIDMMHVPAGTRFELVCSHAEARRYAIANGVLL